VRAYQYEIPDSEIEEFLGPGHQPIRVASPGWALFDLARTLDRLPAMIALDGSKHFYCDGPSAVRALAERYSQRRGSVAAKRFAAAADIRSESPMETELRLFLVDSGFDTFESQVKVPRLGVRIDFADRERKIAVEYDGRGHLTPQQHARDLERWRALVADGWIVLPLGVRDLRHRRELVRGQIRDALLSRGWQPAGCADRPRGPPRRGRVVAARAGVAGAGRRAAGGGAGQRREVESLRQARPAPPLRKRCTKRLNAGAAGGQARRGQVRRARRQARWVRPGPLQAPRAVPPWASARKPRSAAGAGVDLCLLLAAELERRVQGPDALVQLLLAD